jgi:hypothetical protein
VHFTGKWPVKCTRGQANTSAACTSPENGRSSAREVRQRGAAAPGPLDDLLPSAQEPPTLDFVQFNPSTVSVITTTYYPDGTDPVQRVRATLALAAIRSLGFAGYPVTVIDGGSDESIFPIHELGARVMSVDDPDMVFVRQLAAASVVDRSPYLTHMVWTEPEKDITTQIDQWIDRALLEDAAVLVPMRKDVRSYPLHQQLSERAGNEELATVFGREMGDLYFGPRVFRRDAVNRHWLRDFDDYNSMHRQWAAIFSPVFSALAAGDRVVGLPVDFQYPAAQQAVEVDNPVMLEKRRLQRQVITGNATDLRDNLTWAQEWKLDLLDSFTLDAQAIDALQLTDELAAS